MNQRFLRHSLVDWFDQDLVSSTSVAVIGAGAIGNEVLKNLSLLGVGSIHIVDFDHIEEHNLTRSVLFTPSDVGRSKAETAKAACEKIDPNLRITTSTADFWQTLTFDALSRFDAVFCCVDNLEARIRLNQMCYLAGVDLLNAGIDSRHASVEVYPFRSNERVACYECALPPSAYDAIKKRYSCGWLKKVAFHERKIPTTTVTASVAGASMASLFLHQRCKHPNRPTGSTKFSIDTVTMFSSVVAIERFDGCPCCSRHGSRVPIFQSARVSVDERIRARWGHFSNLTITLSEPIIIDCQCKLCGEKRDVLDLASNFDESLAECPKCHQLSNAVRIVDILLADELIERFAAKPLPVKFIKAKLEDTFIVIEMENHK